MAGDERTSEKVSMMGSWVLMGGVDDDQPEHRPVKHLIRSGHREWVWWWAGGWEKG